MKTRSVCFVGNFVGFSGALEVFRNVAKWLKTRGIKSSYIYHIKREGEQAPDMSVFDRVHCVEDTMPREVLGEKIAAVANEHSICHHSLIPVIWRFCLKQCLKVPNVETYHSIEGWKRVWPEYKIRLGAGVERFPDSLVAVSDGLRRQIASDTGWQTERVYNGVNVPMTLPEEPGPYVLYVGRLAHDKGLATWMSVATRVRAKHPEARFMWVGDWTPGTDSRMVELFHAAAPWLELPGFMADPAPYYRSGRVMLMTSPAEGLPMSILEAQSHGVPAVSFDVGDSKESECRIAKDEDDAVRQVCEILENPLSHADRAMLNFKMREYFSAERMAKHYLEIYESCL